MLREDCLSAPRGTRRLALAPRDLAGCWPFVVSLPGSESGRNSPTTPGPLVSRSPMPGVGQGDRWLSHVPELPLCLHAPLLAPGGGLRPRPAAPRPAAGRPRETVGVPLGMAWRVILWSTPLPLSGLDPAVCILIPSSAVRPWLGGHVDGPSDLRARLGSGGTCAGALTHEVTATNCMRGALTPKVSGFPWRDQCVVRCRTMTVPRLWLPPLPAPPRCGSVGTGNGHDKSGTVLHEGTWQ